MSRLQTKRRTLPGTLAGVPGLRLLVPDRPGRRPGARDGRDVIQELGVRSFINAAGTFTALTGR